MLFVFIILNTNSKSKYNGYWLSYFEWYKTLEKKYEVYFYNIYDNKIKINDTEWVTGEKIDFKYLENLDYFYNYNGNKFLFCSTETKNYNILIDFITINNLFNYILLIDHDDILRNTDTRCIPPNFKCHRNSIKMRESWKDIIHKLKYNFIITTNEYNMLLYKKININCKYYLPFTFYFLKNKINYISKIEKKNLCGYQKSRFCLNINNTHIPPKFNLVNCVGTNEGVLNTFIDCKYYLHLDILNKYDKNIAYGEGTGRQLIEAILCHCIPISICTYLYCFLIKYKKYFIRNVLQINNLINYFEIYSEKIELENKNIYERVNSLYSEENFYINLEKIIGIKL